MLCTEHRFLRQLGKSSRKECKAGLSHLHICCSLVDVRRQKAATRNQGTGTHGALPSPSSLDISWDPLPCSIVAASQRNILHNMMDLFKLYSGTVFNSHHQAQTPRHRHPYLSSLSQAHCKLTCVPRFACDDLSEFPFVSRPRQGLSQHSPHNLSPVLRDYN